MPTYADAEMALDYLRVARRLKPDVIDRVDAETIRIAQRAVDEGAPLSAALRASTVAMMWRIGGHLGPQYTTEIGPMGWTIANDEGQVIAQGSSGRLT